MNLRTGEYWKISEKDLLKVCQKLENSVKTMKVELPLIAKDL